MSRTTIVDSARPFTRFMHTTVRVWVPGPHAWLHAPHALGTYAYGDCTLMAAPSIAISNTCVLTPATDLNPRTRRRGVYRVPDTSDGLSFHDDSVVASPHSVSTLVNRNCHPPTGSTSQGTTQPSDMEPTARACGVRSVDTQSQDNDNKQRDKAHVRSMSRRRRQTNPGVHPRPLEFPAPGSPSTWPSPR